MIDQLVEEVIRLRVRVVELEDDVRVLETRMAAANRTEDRFLDHVDAVPLSIPLPPAPDDRDGEKIWWLAGLALMHATRIKLDRQRIGQDVVCTDTFRNDGVLDN